MGIAVCFDILFSDLYAGFSLCGVMVDVSETGRVCVMIYLVITGHGTYKICAYLPVNIVPIPISGCYMFVLIFFRGSNQPLACLHVVFSLIYSFRPATSIGWVFYT